MDGPRRLQLVAKYSEVRGRVMAPSFFSTKIRGIATVVLQVAVGLWFVASAVGKLVGIDEFEIYIYSFGFNNF